MKPSLLLAAAIAAIVATPVEAYSNTTVVSNNCIRFSVGPGTGCAWMCSYCANSLGTNNYYFTDGVCTYQTGGCVGNPQTGVTYTCCSAAAASF